MFDISDENGRVEKSAFMSSIKMWTDNIRSADDSGTVSPYLFHSFHLFQPFHFIIYNTFLLTLNIFVCILFNEIFHN